MSLLGRVTIKLLLIVIVLLVLLFAWIGFTTSGLTFALSQFSGLQVTGEVQGRLFSRVHLNQLSFRNKQLELEIEQVRIEWQPSALFAGELTIKHISIVDLHVVSTPSTERDAQSTSMPEMPFDIDLQQLKIKSISWRNENELPINIDSISLAGRLKKSELTLSQFKLERNQDMLLANGAVDIALSENGIVSLDFSHSISTTNKPIGGISSEIYGSGRLRGTWQALKLEHSTQAPYFSESAVALENILSPERRWEITSRLDQFSVPETFIDKTTVSGSIKSSGDPEENKTTLEILMQSDGKRYRIDLNTEVEGQKAVLNQFLIGKLDNPSSINVAGSIDDFRCFFTSAEGNPSFSLMGGWSDLSFVAAVLERELPASTGKFTIEGDIDDFIFESLATLDDAEFQQLKFELKGSGSRKQISTDKLSMSGAGIQLASKARLTLGDQQTDISITQLKGHLRDQPISGVAVVSLTESSVLVDALRLNVGAATLEGRGNLSRDSKFKWAVSAADLSAISSRAGGSVFASGTLTGPVERPDVSAKIAVNKLMFSEWNLESAQGDVEFGFSKSSPWVGEIKMGTVTQSNRVLLNQSSLVLSGSLQQHAVAATAVTFNDKQTNLYWQGNYANETLNFEGSVNSLPLDISHHLAVQLPVEMMGDVDLDFTGSYDFDSSIELISSVTAKSAALRSTSESHTDMVLQDLNLEFSAAQTVEAKLTASLDDDGKIYGNVQLDAPLFSPELYDSGLTGELSVLYSDLSLVQAILPASVRINGGLSANAKISGSLSKPELEVKASLDQGLLAIPSQGVELRQLNLTLDSIGVNQFQLTGAAESGQGSLNIDGNIDLANYQLPSAEIHLLSDDALFIDTNEINAHGDADLQLNLIENKIDITGSVLVTKANISIKSALSSVSESPDLVLLGAEPKPSAFSMTMSLNLDLGDNTLISTNGLTGQLVGNPIVKLDKKGLLRSVGEVKVIDGLFSVIGQQLKIDRGLVSYTGGAIENPWLSFEATKSVDTTRVGIAINGNVDAPELTLFSQPSLEDQDTLAMIFFEKRVAQLSSVDAIKLIRIANALRSGKTESKVDAITDNVANYLGIDRLEIGLDSKNDQGIFSVSSKINSRLDIGYAYNFFSSLQALFLRYQISPQWSIQSSVDVESGADLQYRIERD